MKCQKCNIEFLEKDIQVSHDIPKYMGGTDADGRHNLCKYCHEDYEQEVLLKATMWLIKFSNEEVKSRSRKAAAMVRDYYFKEDKKEDDTRTINS